MTEEKKAYLPETMDDSDVLHEENVENNVREEKKTKWQFWQTPNLIDDFDLSVYAFRLYQHFKRVCGSKDGSSWQNTKTLSLYCGMSTGMVSNAKKELAEHNPPLIRIEFRKKPNDFGYYHDITILDIWGINEKHFNKEKQVFLPKLDRIEQEKKKRSSPHEQAGSLHETKKNSIRIKPIIPAIAGEQFCEECKEDKMCEKCEMLKKKIELGTEYGFEFDVKNSKKMLKNLNELHKTEDPAGHKKVTQNERIVAMMQGSKDEYADKLADYPDRCRKPLNYFLHKWNFAPSSVPKKSKSKGGSFATWINGIDELVAISGERNFELVLDKTYEIWYNRSNDYKNVVDMPQKIKPLFTSCNNIVRQEIAEKMQEEVKKAKEKTEEKKEFVNAEDGAKMLKQLQKSLQKGK